MMTRPWSQHTNASLFAYFPVRHHQTSDRWMVLRRTADTLSLSTRATTSRVDDLLRDGWETECSCNRGSLRHLQENVPQVEEAVPLLQSSGARGTFPCAHPPETVGGDGDRRGARGGLRRAHLRWGREKLQRWYQETYRESISSWKIGRVITKWQLYPDPETHRKRASRQRRSAA